MDGKIDLRALIQKLISRWHYFLVTLLVVVPLAYAYTRYADPIYEIRASILLNGEVKNGINSEKFLKGMELLTSNTEIEDEIGILKSYNLVGSTINKLDFGVSVQQKQNFKTRELYGNDSPIQVELDSTVNQIVNVPVYVEMTSPKTYTVRAAGKDVSTYNFYSNQLTDRVPSIDIHDVCQTDKRFHHKNLAFRIKINDSPTFQGKEGYFFVIHDLGSITESYRNKLDIKPISRESNLVEIRLRGKTPEKETLFLNKLLDVYLTDELQKRNQLGIKTIEFIDTQLSGVSNELRQVEGSLESFRSRNNILDITATAENLTKNLDRLEEDKSTLESRLKYYKYIASSLDNGNNLQNIGAPSTFGLEDPLLNDLLLELSRLTQERIGLNYSTREGNPVAEVIDLKIANHKKTLIENVNNFIKASTIALEDLINRIAKIQHSVRGLPGSERELVSIQRRFDFNDHVYNYLVEKRAEAGIAIASNTLEKTIVDRAQQVGSGPISPNKKWILLFATLFGLALAVGLVIIKDLINDSIITTEDVEKSTRIPFIGTIIHGNKRERSLGIIASSKSPVGESFRSLRVNLQYLTLGKDNNVVGFTSSVASEGKTFCSTNLASAMAQSGRRTILVDADLRRPKVAASFRMKDVKGLSNFLIGDCSLEEIINTTPEGLDVIPSGPIPPNPLDLLGLPKMDELISTLKQNYNTVIIDSPPLGPVSEFIILMKYTNANIFVVRSNQTTRHHLEKINKLYEDRKISNVSILLNDAKSPYNGYSYSY